MKMFIVKTPEGKSRLIEAATRGRVENAILEAYSIEPVKGSNAADALALQAGGVQVERLED